MRLAFSTSAVAAGWPLISRAQDAVVSRLTRGHASVLRRYTSVPMLALEIDATTLGALETMTDLVAGVKPDLTRRPQ